MDPKTTSRTWLQNINEIAGDDAYALQGPQKAITNSNSFTNNFVHQVSLATYRQEYPGDPKPKGIVYTISGPSSPNFCMTWSKKSTG